MVTLKRRRIGRMSSAVVEDVSVHEDEVLICCGVELFLVLIMDLLSLELFNLELNWSIYANVPLEGDWLV